MSKKITKKIANWYYLHGYKFMDKKSDGVTLDDVVALYEDIEKKKQERISNKKHWPEIYVPNVTEKCWSLGAYTLCFVYSNKGNFVLKGWIGDIDKYFKYLKNKGYKFFYYKSMYHYGIERGYWSFHNDDVYIHEPTLKNSKTFEKYHFVVKNSLTKKKFKFKRLPNKWIPEFDQL
jgi:hypothetical protein